MNNNIQKQLVSLNFEEVIEDEYKIIRTFTKGNFSVIQFFCAKKTEILLYKENKTKERLSNFLASFIDNNEGWELAKFCCKELYTQEQHKTASLKNIYTNGIMLSPDGEIMCRCGKDRIKWYLKKGLATLESENPLTIKLNFEPEACGKKDDLYYLQEIKNQCVVCGSTENLSKHHVIPYCFRKFLPKEIKENSSHDILLLCREHHNKYEKEADKLKKELANEYKCSLYGKNLKIDVKLKKIKEAAIELLKKNNKISPLKRRKFKNLIKNHYNKRKIFQTDLESAAKIKYKTKDKEHVDFGEHIVNSISSLDEFMIMWRKHFVKLLEPKFLPQYWDINKKI